MEVPTVVRVRSWAGLDVHATKVVAAVVDAKSGELRVRRLGGEVDAVASFVAGFPGPVRATYEAGPTGFGLARALERAGLGCVVAAPGKIPVAPTDHIKTDRQMPRGWFGC
jgi:transposase